MNESAKRLGDLVKTVKGHGGIKDVEDLFNIRFGDLRRSVRGPSFDLTMRILEYLEYPPEAFVQSEKLNHSDLDIPPSEPEWWDEFESVRLDDPYKALQRLPEPGLDSGWRSLAIGMVADQWGKKEMAIRYISRSPDRYRLHRNLAPVYAETSLPMALFHSGQAASIAVFSGRPTMAIVVERVGILFAAEEFEAAKLQIGTASTRDLKPLEIGAFWQLKAGIQVALGEDSSSALRHAEEIASDNLSRNFSGHVRWIRARYRRCAATYWDAITSFGEGFPRKAALVAIELHEVDPGAGALGLAAELFRSQGFKTLACIVENEIARARLRTGEEARKAIERWARARTDRALRVFSL